VKKLNIDILDITDLKKVTSDMQTHKNTSLRTGPAPFKAPVVSNNSSQIKTTLPANAPIDKPPVFTRDGKKWLIVSLFIIINIRK
jgi:adenylyl cyclase-associated protein